MEVAATQVAQDSLDARTEAGAQNGVLKSPSPPNVKRTGIILRPNNSRVVIRPFEPADDHRIERILGRVCALSEAEVDFLLEDVMREFRDRHQKTCQFFLQRFERVKRLMLTDRPLSENRKLLIGSYFTQEYALESAALFNPSMVWAPDQSGLPEGSKRFILSLRATGEGHISSITFRSGVVNAQHGIRMDEPTRLVTAPNFVPNTLYDKVLFLRKLIELRLDGPFAETVLDALDDQFTNDELEAAVARILHQNRPRHHELEPLAQGILTLAQANYEITFNPELSVSERIIFPSSPTETNGIEDARFVRFEEVDGSVRYYATYTAYNGKVVLPQLLETNDFLRFKASTLNGPEVRNKGMALFPRKVNGLYAMISRQDNENIFLMYSDMLHFWYTKEQIAKPTYSWEFVQLGNCGSPIETEAGWLVLTHGVGAMRKYAMGAFLLDLNDPSRVIGRLERPLLEPNANEREGYVPNVVYSCGAVVHNGVLIIPYAMSDYASTFATIPVDELLNAMVRT
ncbi:MAG: glycoside hydrolase family 130 protein [Paludisphaera borealis]|uniref:glycoside hydrolase family 130 protein n=1 Tax=Paludisphaera borealis TaxID=1387353 RepID=UPI002848273C|nr:glycoside hydrolase family 130 protein [Paludisphaera borealis]MDR3620738.1 glycoside hydrolase family 130 protein [Paludisphaera borealis]